MKKGAAFGLPHDTPGAGLSYYMFLLMGVDRGELRLDHGRSHEWGHRKITGYLTNRALVGKRGPQKKGCCAGAQLNIAVGISVALPYAHLHRKGNTNMVIKLALDDNARIGLEFKASQLLPSILLQEYGPGVDKRTTLPAAQRYIPLADWHRMCDTAPAHHGVYLTRVTTNEIEHFAFMYYDDKGWHPSLALSKVWDAPYFTPGCVLQEDTPAFQNLDFAGLIWEEKLRQQVVNTTVVRRVMRGAPAR